MAACSCCCCSEASLSRSGERIPLFRSLILGESERDGTRDESERREIQLFTHHSTELVDILRL